MKKGILSWIAFVLVIIGGLNWGLVGILNYNLVSSLFGTGTFTNVVYILVGVSALWLLIGKFIKK